MMQIVRVTSVVVVAVMAVAIAFGIATAQLGSETRAVLDLTWGVVMLVDLYASFAFVWLWIAWREGDVPKAVVWLVLIMTLGSLAIAAYVALAAFRSDSPRDLLLGAKHA